MQPDALARFHAALGSEIRLRIVELVASLGEMCVCELVDELGMSQANVSRHVAILRDAGILSARKVGTWVLLRVDEAALDRGLSTLSDGVRAALAIAPEEDAEERMARRCASRDGREVS